MAFRAFISVDVPALRALTELAEGLGKTGAALKLIDIQQVHLTLKFLGETEEALVPQIVGVMRTSVAGIPAFNVRLVGTGAFPNLGRMNVVWVGMEGAEPLEEVARRLEAGMEPFGYPRERRGFSPHVTIARVKGQRGLGEVRRLLEAHAGESFGDVRVERIRLKKSVLRPEGPSYSTVEDVPL